MAFPPMVPPPKFSIAAGKRPSGGNVGSTYSNNSIRTNCSTTVATASVVVRNFEQPGALRTDSVGKDVNDRIAVDRTVAVLVKIFDSSGERPAGGNVGSTYTDKSIRNNCSTTVAKASRWSFEISNNPVPCALILPPTPMLMIALPLIELPPNPLRLALSIRKLASPLVVARSPLRSENRMAIPPIVPPLLLSIAALRVPVETLFAVTLMMAWEPIVVPSPAAVGDLKGRVFRR